MAAVTQNATAQENVPGSLRQRIWSDIDIAASGDTLVSGFQNIYHVSFTDVAITSVAWSGGTITFTTTGAVTGVSISVWGN